MSILQETVSARPQGAHRGRHREKEVWFSFAWNSHGPAEGRPFSAMSYVSQMWLQLLRTANEPVHLRLHSWDFGNHRAGKAVGVLEVRARCARGPIDSLRRPDSTDISCERCFWDGAKRSHCFSLVGSASSFQHQTLLYGTAAHGEEESLEKPLLAFLKALQVPAPAGVHPYIRPQ